MPPVLVVIPAYNEAGTIEEVVRRTHPHADVCVVDDCSTDRTAEILAVLEGIHVIRHHKNTHIAGAVLDGMRYALASGYEYMVAMDAGLSHNPDELPRFIEAEHADLVIGTRNREGEKDKPVYRRFLSMAGSMLMNLILWVPRRDGPRWIHDCTSGYRRYSRRAMHLLTTTPMQCRSFDFLLETLVIAVRSGCSVREVPISYRFTNSCLNHRIVMEALKTWWRLSRRPGKAKRTESPWAKAGEQVAVDKKEYLP
ncbi:MAG: glycosyltransferase family 2 protein [Acidobacteria bacterium]|nr:glycosyltransferase family 2 protein [Acidobacteriota bacterium]